MISFRPSALIVSALLTTVVCMEVRADAVITEFVASNDGSYLDEDGDPSDWIEIRNTGTAAMSLENWKITDNAADLSKWTFPNVTLQPGEIIVVFASGKDRSAPGSELHTNFSLAQSGEYLALLTPGGVVSTAFSPSYPPQETGSSYGTSTPSNTVVLVTENDACKARVPDAAYHASIGNTWRSNTPAFDETSWQSGVQGVGYERNNGFQDDINLDVESAMYNNNTSVYMRIPVHVPVNPSDILSLTLRMKYDDGFAAFVNGAIPASGKSYAPGTLTWNSTTEGGTNPEASATEFEDFDLSDVIPSLVSGSNNILAIQGLNATSTSSDALYRCELVATVADVGAATTGYFSPPTPGTINGSTTFSGFLTDTTFAHGRGIYYSSFSETISCPDLGATIIYTTDGSVPSQTNGAQILPPDEFTPPSGTVSITGTTVLRAIAVKADHRPTNVDTVTYLFPDQVPTQSGAGLPLYTSGSSIWDYEMDPAVVNDSRYADLATDLLSLPTLSIVMPVEDVWGSNGVYRNPTSEGSAWERACSVEVINPDGSPNYQMDGGLRIQGSGSRRRAIGKKSMRLAFRKQYGSSRFKYPLWGPTGPGEVSNIVLRGSYFDSWTFQSDGGGDGITRSNALQFRTHYATVAHARTGNLTVSSNWVHLYINGKYWGPYNTHERPDGEFAELHNGGDEDDYSVIKNPGELIQGSKAAWDALMSLCNGYGSGFDAVKHQAILDQIDQDQFIDYIFANFWGGNADWPHNNWYVHRNDTTGGPFLFYMWDPEHYLYASNNRTGVNDANSPGIIYDRLRRGTEFQVSFGDRVHKHMFNEGIYSVTSMQTLMQDIADELEPAMNCESARWGDEHTSSPYNTIDHWLPEVSYRKNTWIPARSDTFLNELRSKNLYPDTDAPVFSQHGGTIVSGYQLAMTNPNGSGTIYYTLDGSDPRLTGGNVAGTAQTYSGSAVTLTSSGTVKARVRNNNGEWSALNEAGFTTGSIPTLANLVISEFNYNPADVTSAEQSAGFNDKDDFEFIELMNTGMTAIDLSSLAFDNSVEGIEFDFSSLPDPLLAPGQRIVLAKNSQAYAARYGSSSGVAGNYSGRLSNSGETLTLTQGGNVLLSFSYDDDSPWPDSADGQGASLVLINPMSNPAHGMATNWRASGQINGTPGTEEILPTPPANPLGDADSNGRADLIDYVLIGRPVSGMNDFLTISFTIDPKAEAATTTVQYSDDLIGWTSAANKIAFVSETYNANGTVTYVWQSLTPPSSGKQFLRVRVDEK
ncbi:lamin tail domain-containing protein [Oceaniferula spumae]